MQISVSRALQRMADRAQMAKTQEEVDSYKHRAQEVHHRINFLENCRPDIVGAIDRLKRSRAELAKEMEQITKEIAAEEKKLQELPTIIGELKQERQHLARETIRLRRRV
ncbi:aminotransferase-like protein [Panicum miliaceum]|uniref:Aminotransferase-like protein n=1 Tax=Panicum miliaceum TaxID=4540 RepID=A0A3L6QR09_PANMI|nr:aminotransferase-like protein [Panicum miliaceum]